MTQISRAEIFAQAARKLRSDFDALTVIPHNASKGHEAEEIIRRFLNDHLPKRFVAGCGFIIDAQGAVSNQADVVVYDAHNCPVYRASDSAAIFPSNNVAVVVEVKSRLNKEAIEDAASKIARVKGLVKSKSPNVPFLVTSQTMGVLFAFASDIKLATVGQHYRQTFGAHGIGRHIDVIAVLDQGVVTLVGKMRDVSGWNIVQMDDGLGGEAAEGGHIAISIMELGEYTLDVLFRLLLPQLAQFRQIVDHPGFDFASLPIKNHMTLSYLMSITTETDPVRKEVKLRQYAAEVEKEFAVTKTPSSENG
jgi:hypothetical protein